MGVHDRQQQLEPGEKERSLGIKPSLRTSGGTDV